MDKAILVINMPNRCSECPICASWQGSAFSIREYWCTVEDNTGVDPYDKPNWCPLKPLPDKVEVFMDDWAEGYNYCLREIVGEYNED